MAARLKQDIAAGHLLELIRSHQVGDVLPSALSLVDRLGASNATIDKAYRILARMGYVATEKIPGMSGPGRRVVVSIPDRDTEIPLRPARTAPPELIESTKNKSLHSHTKTYRILVHLAGIIQTSEVGDQLPTIDSLCGPLGVSYGPTQGAYQYLIREGAVEVRDSAGHFVVGRLRPDHPLLDLDHLRSQMRDLALSVDQITGLLAILENQ